MDVKDYIKIFEQSSGLVLVIDVNFIIEAVSDDFIKKTKTTRVNITGRDIFEVFPFNSEDKTGNGENKIRASFNRVIKNKTADTLPIIRYDIPKPESEGGGFEAKYWKVVNSPILDTNNNVKYIIQRSDDVTGNETIAAQLQAEQKALKQIEDSEKRYNMMLMKSPFAFAILKGKNMVITLANDSVKEMWGKGKDIEGKSLLEVLPEIKDSEFPGLLDKVYTTGTPFCGDEVLCPVFRNGKLEDVYFNFVYQPYLEADETISGVTIIAIEVTNEVIVKQKIKDSQLQLQNIFMQAPFALNIYEGKELVISLTNKLFCEIIGKTESEILGKKLFDAFPETATQGLDKILSDIFSTGIPFKGNEFPVHFLKHGNVFEGYFDFIYQPIFDYNKNVSGVINVAIDVTDKVLARKKIEESEHRYHELIYSSPSMIAIFKGEDMIIEIANDSIMESWSKGKDIIGKSLLSIMPEVIEQGFDKILSDVYKTGIPFHAYEAPVSLVRNGKLEVLYYTYVYQAQRNINGEIEGVAVIASEVTPQAEFNLKIRASEVQFRSLVAQAPVAICIFKGRDFIVEVANKAFLQIVGKAENEYVGKPVFDSVPETRTIAEPLLLEVLNTGVPYFGNELENTITRYGKTEQAFFNFVYQPIIGNDGTATGIIVVATEVTEQVLARKKIEVSENKFRLLTNNMPQKISNADADGNVIFFSQQWLDDTGLTFEELKDWGWEKAMHPDDLEFTVNNWKHSVVTGDIFDLEHRIQNKEGEYRWHLSRAVPVKDETGKIVMWVGSNTDIHELKEAKNEAQTAQLTAEDAMQAKQQFLSNMSHEIRTPMNAIIGFTNVLLKSKLEKTHEEYLMAIKLSGDALLVLINDILDLAKVDAGKMTFEQTPFNLVTSLSAMLQLFEIKIKEKNLKLVKQFDSDIPKIIMGDPMRLRQIILNLISNAVKFTEAGKITLSVSLINQDAEKTTIKFTVTDTGIGIHKNKLEHIFDDFGQATYENSRLYGGTGLGLTIVKKLIEQQGGTIRVESELGKGAAFSFQLSFAKTNQKIKPETEQVSNKQIDMKNINVLVAEDMPLNQLLIKIILADFGFEVDIADNGKIAIEKLQQNKYDLVLMDLQMPEMNGFDATDHVRKTMNSNIPIIALTADVTSIDVEKALAVGMNDYISKPIDEQLLYNKIIKVLHKTE